ncbi:hypothetical protein GCM10010297_21720 [Streptomyces malachitofuscus]|nr:hypothetical protein GCM10010297_21720 [Streptomyces malachitofuscus]
MIATVVPAAVVVQVARALEDVRAALAAAAAPNVPVAAAARTALAAMVALGVRETGIAETVVRTVPT